MNDALQREVEIILIRRWASYVTLPLFLIAADGELMYYNDVAGKMLGRPFDESDPMTADELSEIFATSTDKGAPMPSEQLPAVRALRAREPAYGRIRYRALDGRDWSIEICAMPLVGLAGRFLGVLVAFWEANEP